MKLPKLPRGEVGPDGWPLHRKERLPAWLRITIRFVVLLPIWPLHLGGMLAEWIYEMIDPYLPRGL